MNLHFMLFTVLLPAVVAIAVYGISLPNLQNGLMFAVSAVLGAVIIFEIQYILGMVAFFLTTVWFASFYITGFMTLFGATAIPLWYYPEWLAEPVLLPAVSLHYIRADPNLPSGRGEPAANDTRPAFVDWGLCLLEKLVWRRAERKLVVQGG